MQPVIGEIRGSQRGPHAALAHHLASALELLLEELTELGRVATGMVPDLISLSFATGSLTAAKTPR